jgi:hypothetical protein
MFTRIVFFLVLGILLHSCEKPEIGFSQELKAHLASRYSKGTLEYFKDIAFGAEHGRALPLIRKWKSDISVSIRGEVNNEDKNELKIIIDDLNEIIHPVKLFIDEGNTDIVMHIIAPEKFTSVSTTFKNVALGAFTTKNDLDYYIYHSEIIVSSNIQIQQIRNHILREELTQSLGLMKDSYRFKDSIFYQGSSYTTEYSQIDKEIIEILYNSDIPAGLTLTEYEKFLNEI